MWLCRRKDRFNILYPLLHSNMIKRFYMTTIGPAMNAGTQCQATKIQHQQEMGLVEIDSYSGCVGIQENIRLEMRALEEWRKQQKLSLR